MLEQTRNYRTKGDDDDEEDADKEEEEEEKIYSRYSVHTIIIDLNPTIMTRSKNRFYFSLFWFEVETCFAFHKHTKHTNGVANESMLNG